MFGCHTESSTEWPFIHTYTHIHTYIHTHIHTHTYIHNSNNNNNNYNLYGAIKWPNRYKGISQTTNK